MPSQDPRQVCIKRVLIKEDAHTATGTQHFGMAGIILDLFECYGLTQIEMDETRFVIQQIESRRVTNPTESNVKVPGDRECPKPQTPKSSSSSATPTRGSAAAVPSHLRAR